MYLYVVKKIVRYEIDIEIDGITNSIENLISGDSFSTDVLPLRDYDLKAIGQKSNWSFNWKKEFKIVGRQLYKLTITGNPSIIQGLLSVSDEGDHYYIHLIESAPFNQGRNKLYVGVPGNLVAFACKLSKEKGYSGFVAFLSKTKLVTHYQKTLGASPFGKGPKMIIYPEAANHLITRYFKN